MLEFFIAALVVGIAPGPDNLFVLTQSATHGARAGFCVILGLCVRTNKLSGPGAIPTTNAAMKNSSINGPKSL